MADPNTQENPVEVFDRSDTIVGQPQATPAAPHDGATLVREVVVHTDKKILDPNDPLAVQIPEGSGASTVGHESALATALRQGTAEEQFARAEKQDSEPSSEAASQEETPKEPADEEQHQS